jgi:CheY-like chemotaxis protein
MAKWKYRLDMANNGAEAIEKLKEKDYDLILMDIQMPEIDGYTATRIIRDMKDERKKNIPIIAITAHASNSEAERCINIGMNAYVSKPFNANYLKKVIMQLMNKTGKPEKVVVKNVSKGKPLFNLDYLIDHADGDKEFIIEMITLFINDVPQALTKLKTSIDQKNYGDIKIYAHSMKGLFLTLGIEETGDIIKQVERLADNKYPIEEIRLKYNEIEKCYNEVKEPLKMEIKELK